MSDRDGESISTLERPHCEYCGEPHEYMTLDHKLPLSRDGSDELDNLALACKTCNSKKGAKTPDEFTNWKRAFLMLRRRWKPVSARKYSLYMTPDLMMRARACVSFLSGPPEHLTLTALIAQAVEEKLAKLKNAYNDGSEFPPTRGKLRCGARPKGEQS